MMRQPPHFEWTFSSRVRERQCSRCPVKTTGFLTLSNGARKPPQRENPLNAIASTFGMTGKQYLKSLISQT